MRACEVLEEDQIGLAGSTDTAIFETPLLPGENAADYQRLRANIGTEALTFSARLLRELAIANAWDARRYRRASGARLVEQVNTELLGALAEALAAGGGQSELVERRAEKLLERYVGGSLEARAEVKRRLATIGLTLDSIEGRALCADLDLHCTLGDAIGEAEKRVRASLREADRLSAKRDPSEREGRE